VFICVYLWFIELLIFMRIFRSSVVAVAFLFAGSAGAAALDIPTPYLPSTTVAVDEMLRLGGVGPDDMVVDLGSGDGRIVIAAARDYGARGLGIELDPQLVAESQANARQAGVADRVSFRQGDALAVDIREATVVTLYLLPGLVEKLKPRLLAQLKPGTRIIAHDYGFEGWKPDRRVVVSKTYMLYVVPAPVAGRWRLTASLPSGEREFEFELEQQYQDIRGGARVPGGFMPAFEARLEGDRISFVLVEDRVSHRFEGRVSGTLLMEGTVRSGPGRNSGATAWRATRVVRGGDEG
jgi:protein-L-isoaspartate O-methyltransferase